MATNAQVLKFMLTLSLNWRFQTLSIIAIFKFYPNEVHHIPIWLLARYISIFQYDNLRGTFKIYNMATNALPLKYILYDSAFLEKSWLKR